VIVGLLSDVVDGAKEAWKFLNNPAGITEIKDSDIDEDTGTSADGSRSVVRDAKGKEKVRYNHFEDADPAAKTQAFQALLSDTTADKAIAKYGGAPSISQANNITVTVPPGTDPKDVPEAVTGGVDKAIRGLFADAYKASGKFAPVKD
jgi:hypothetical protein